MNSLNDWAYGRFDIEKPALKLNLKDIIVEIKQGESLDGSISLSTESNATISGYVINDSPFIRFTQNSFNGSSVDLGYNINTQGLYALDESEGLVRLFTNLEIVDIPFRLKVLPSKLSLGNVSISDIEQFCMLARENYNTATDFFFNESFSSVVLNNEPFAKAVYEQIRLAKYQKEAVDRFLHELGKKKKPVISFVDTSANRVFAPKATTEYSFGLNIDVSSHIAIDVSCDEPFIELSDKTIEYDENNSSIIQYRYSVKPTFLRAGLNEALIHLDNDLQRISYRVLVDNSVLSELDKKKRSKKKNLIIILINKYIEFRLGRLKIEEWAVQSLEYVNVLERLYDDLFIKLYKVHLLMGINNMEKARLLLYSLDIEDDTDITNKAYFLYLIAFFKDDEKFADDLKEDLLKYRNDREDLFSILWFLLFLDDDYVEDIHKRYRAIKEQYLLSGDNVLLLCEAAVMLNKSPELLSEFSDFEIQACHFALKRNYINGALWNAIFYISSFARSFRSGVYRLLMSGYDKYLTADRLETICGYCVTGGCIGVQFLPIYEQAIMQGTAITGVYEYYLRSLPLYFDKPILKQALHYFKYKTDISDEDRALLFVNIHKYYQNDEIFAGYEEYIREFTLVALNKRLLNENTIYLYNNILRVEDINSANVDSVAFICLLYVVKIDRSDVTAVTIVDSRIANPINARLINSQAIVPIASLDVAVSFELTDGSIHLDKSLVKLTKLITRTDLLKACENYAVSCFEYQLYKNDYISLVESDILVNDFKIKCNNEATGYYAKNPFDNRASAYIELVDTKLMSLKSKIELASLNIMYNRFNDAVRILNAYGYYNVNIEQLSNLTEELIKLDDKEALMSLIDDSWFVGLCTYLYNKGYRSHKLVGFLSNCMQGNISELVKLWENCGYIKVEKSILEEKILQLSCYLRTYDPITLPVYESYTNNIVNKKIALAYLSLISFNYYILKNDLNNKKKIFFHIVNYYMNFKNLSGVCILATLKYLATAKAYTNDDRHFIVATIKEHFEKGIYFDIFDSFIRVLNEENVILDGAKRQKRLVTHIDESGRLILIKYKLLNAKGLPIDSMSDYIRGTMQELYPCIYIRDFIIFVGESIKYIIVSFDNDTETELYENTLTVQGRKLKNERKDRYELIEELILAMDTDREIRLHKNIASLDKINKEMFLIR